MNRSLMPTTLLLAALLLAGCGGPAPEPPASLAQATTDDQALPVDPAPLHPLPPAPGEVRPPAVPIVAMEPDDE